MEPENKQDIVGFTNYNNEEVVALYRHENMLGAQFHPERSGEVGLRFLEFVILSATLWK
jgi:glutamine amidotransferase